jgi:hypothetical protein
MSNSNALKDALLGEPHGTAQARLRKSIIFFLAKGKEGVLPCYRCGGKIEVVEDLSIEHKESWQRASDPKASFFDLGNIAFSHLRCNSGARANAPRSGYPNGTAWCCGCRKRLPLSAFYMDASSGRARARCRDCYAEKRRTHAGR